MPTPLPPPPAGPGAVGSTSESPADLGATSARDSPQGQATPPAERPAKSFPLEIERDPRYAPRIHALAADPFFARLLSFDLACPNCNELIVVRHGRFGGGKVSKLGPGLGSAHWKPRYQEFTCPSCSRDFVLGLLAWSRALAPPLTRKEYMQGGHAGRPPVDTIPDARQALRIRQLTGGFWPARRLRHGTVKHPMLVNRTLTVPCPCQPNATSQGQPLPDPRCPLHGDAKPLSLPEIADRNNATALSYYAARVKVQHLRWKAEVQARELEARARVQADLREFEEGTAPVSPWRPSTHGKKAKGETVSTSKKRKGG